MTRWSWIVLAACFAMAAPALATTWDTSATSPDPYAEGRACQTPQPVSYGSYIYAWPSRYDGVYWPYIDANWVWRCPSGYMSFGGDFEPRSDEERARVAAFLASNQNSATAPLDRLEAIYQAREMPAAFWSHFYRLRAHLASDERTADAFRARAAPFLEAQIADVSLTGMDRIQALYLLGFYTRRLGDRERSGQHFAAARAVVWSDEDGAAHTGSPYFEEMIVMVERGELDGAVPR